MTSNKQEFFRRFRWADTIALAGEIAAARAQLASARIARDRPAELENANRLGFHLTLADQETEAASVLESALILARQLADHSTEVDVLGNLALAHQYLGQRDLAQTLFREALVRAKEYGISEYNHYILHHQGRCYVEQGNIAMARDCFEQALELRKQLGDPHRIANTEAALDALNRL